jgi:hypothetical protein
VGVGCDQGLQRVTEHVGDIGQRCSGAHLEAGVRVAKRVGRLAESWPISRGETRRGDGGFLARPRRASC